MSESNYLQLLRKIDEFIRKYYINRMIRGGIYFLGISLLVFIVSVLLEYFGKFNASVRTVIFYTSSGLILGLIFIQLLWPLFKLLSIGKRINNQQASRIIGAHFPHINDKLSNIFQLKSIESSSETDLISASINQKIDELKPIPFALAVNFKDNLKYVKYAIIPFVIFVLIGLIQPSIIKDGTSRLVAHTSEFIPVTPYEITILNKELNAFKNTDYTLEVKLTGDEIPDKIFLDYDAGSFLMKKEENNRFSYKLRNLNRALNFNLFDGTYRSKNYELKIIPKPLLIDFQTTLEYPKYLKKSSEVVQNNGDLTVPAGTNIKWSFKTEETESMLFIEQDSSSEVMLSGENEYVFEKQLLKSQNYGLSVSNQHLKYQDTITYFLKVIPDLSPSIELDVEQDSSSFKRFYFKGMVKDDYGFTRLKFYASIRSENGAKTNKIEKNISINTALTQTDFFFVWNSDEYNIQSGDQVEYYFEIWDNDGVNGSKSARSKTQLLNTPSQEDLSNMRKESNEQIKEDLEESIELTKEIQKDLEELNERILDKKDLGYQEKQLMEDILKKQKAVENSIERFSEENKKKNMLQNEFEEESEELLSKQEQLEDLFEKVMSEEMKEMMKEIEKMLKELNKKDLQESLDKIELSNKDLSKELDRNLELFKQLELEKELAETKEKLDALKEEQKDLKEETKDGKKGEDELESKQKELNEEFEKISENLDEIEKKNKELENPNELEKTDNLEERIKEEMKDSQEQLSKNQKNKASESQENAEQQMDQLSQKLGEMQMQMQSSANAENLEDLRALLENLIQLSFDQEEVMETLKKTDRNDPQYLQLAQKQRKLKDDSKIIEDSLFALSKRVVELEAKVNTEISSINYNMDKAIDELGERNTKLANNRQQLSMTSINNLALMLDEAIQAMQMQMQMQQGKGKCQKPGSGKPSSSSMKKLQQQLNKQMGQLKKEMENGKSPNGKKQGQKGKGKAGMSKELAQMAAKQAAIRKELNKLQEELGNGNGGNKLKKLEELMEKTETDLVNKRITNETLMRQKEILSRLLESEKAEREREKEKKRESTEFTDVISRNQNLFLEYNSRKEKELELLRTLPPSFSNFYKSKVSEYFNQIEK